MTIQIPRTAASRRELTYAKLLFRVHPDRTMVNAFEGVLLRPGSAVEPAALRPSEDYPEKPLLLEFAGSDRTGRGHHRSRQIHVLWRFEPETRTWFELARTLSEGAEWIAQLMPVALRALGGPPLPDSALAGEVTKFFLSQLDTELKALAAADRFLTLNLLYEHVAARLVNAAGA